MSEIEKRRVARFKVGGDLLGEMLALPQGTRVLRVEPGDWMGRLGPMTSVELYIESPGLPEVPQDELVPQVMPAVQSNRYAVETLVSAVNHFMKAEGVDSATLAFAEMKKAVAAVQAAGGTLVRFLDWNLPHAPVAPISADGPKEIDGTAGVWTVKRYLGGEVFCDDCAKSIAEAYFRLPHEGTPFCKRCAAVSPDQTVIRLPDVDLDKIAKGGAS
jgi:hypothetical protein